MFKKKIQLGNNNKKNNNKQIKKFIFTTMSIEQILISNFCLFTLHNRNNKTKNICDQNKIKLKQKKMTTKQQNCTR